MTTPIRAETLEDLGENTEKGALLKEKQENVGSGKYFELIIPVPRKLRNEMQGRKCPTQKGFEGKDTINARGIT